MLLAGARTPASSPAGDIEAETHALLVRKLGCAIAREWLLTGGLPVVRVLPSEEQRAREILLRYQDQN